MRLSKGTRRRPKWGGGTFSVAGNRRTTAAAVAHSGERFGRPGGVLWRGKERVMEEGVVGIYMGPEATEDLQLFLTNLIRKQDRVGVKEIRLDVGDDDVIAGVIDGARMSVEGREVGYCWAAVCCTRGREEMGSGWSRWPRPFFFFLYENKHFLLSVFFYKFRFRPPIQVK